MEIVNFAMMLVWCAIMALMLIVFIKLGRNKDRAKLEDPVYTVVKLDFYSYEYGCWHCTFYDEGVKKNGLVTNLSDPELMNRCFYCRVNGMGRTLWDLEVITLPIEMGEIILQQKQGDCWNCLFPDENFLALVGKVVHFEYVQSSDLFSGKVLMARCLDQEQSFFEAIA
jgi:hypothetical protein